MIPAPRSSLLLACAGLPLQALAQTGVPNEFSAGEPARAAEVNENFSVLAEGLDRNATAVAENTAAIEALEDANGGALAGGAASVTVVAASGGDYTSPLDAVANVDDGDAWCRQPSDDPPAFPCVISIAPGIYELGSTLVVPPFVSLVGYGPLASVLAAGPGVETTLQLGSVFPGPSVASGSGVRDLTVRNHEGSGARSVALATAEQGGFEIHNVHASAAGSNENIAVHERGEQAGPPNRYSMLVASATGGATSIGLAILLDADPQLDGCTLTAADATANFGIRNVVGGIAARNCTITASGGQDATGIEAVSESIYAGGAVRLADSVVAATGAAATATGFRGRSIHEFFIDDVEFEARDAIENVGFWISLNPPFETGRLDDVAASATGGAISAGIFQEGGHSDIYSFDVAGSRISGSAPGSGNGYGVLLGSGTEGQRISIDGSAVNGSTVPIFYDGPVWLDFPAATIGVRFSTVYGPIDVNGHYVICRALSDRDAFYPDSCPAGSDYTEFAPP